MYIWKVLHKVPRPHFGIVDRSQILCWKRVGAYVHRPLFFPIQSHMYYQTVTFNNVRKQISRYWLPPDVNTFRFWYYTKLRLISKGNMCPLVFIPVGMFFAPTKAIPFLLWRQTNTHPFLSGVKALSWSLLYTVCRDIVLVAAASSELK